MPTEQPSPHRSCSQCGRPAVCSINGHPLCVDHYAKLQEAKQIEFARNAAMLNFALRSFHHESGLGDLMPPPPQLAIPQPMAYVGQNTFHNIHVEGSTVGAINTGHAMALDARVSVFKETGHSDLGEQLKSLTQAVIDAKDVAVETKNEIIELLSFVSAEVLKPQPQRSHPLGKAALSMLDKLLAVSSNLATLWGSLGPVFSKYLSYMPTG